ncbi:MAG: hypothetical protein QM751_06840 [Paludibacteraceae bacterium]
METFSDVSDIEKEVSQALSYTHHSFPEMKIPAIYFFVQGLTVL